MDRRMIPRCVPVVARSGCEYNKTQTERDNILITIEDDLSTNNPTNGRESVIKDVPPNRQVLRDLWSSRSLPKPVYRHRNNVNLFDSMSKYQKEVSHGLPIDLTGSQCDVSPLDLSIKTRPRLADSTRGSTNRDNDVIMLPGDQADHQHAREDLAGRVHEVNSSGHQAVNPSNFQARHIYQAPINEHPANFSYSSRQRPTRPSMYQTTPQPAFPEHAQYRTRTLTMTAPIWLPSARHRMMPAVVHRQEGPLSRTARQVAAPVQKKQHVDHLTPSGPTQSERQMSSREEMTRLGMQQHRSANIVYTKIPQQIRNVSQVVRNYPGLSDKSPPVVSSGRRPYGTSSHSNERTIEPELQPVLSQRMDKYMYRAIDSSASNSPDVVFVDQQQVALDWNKKLIHQHNQQSITSQPYILPPSSHRSSNAVPQRGLASSSWTSGAATEDNNETLTIKNVYSIPESTHSPHTSTEEYDLFGCPGSLTPEPYCTKPSVLDRRADRQTAHSSDEGAANTHSICPSFKSDSNSISNRKLRVGRFNSAFDPTEPSQPVSSSLGEHRKELSPQSRNVQNIYDVPIAEPRFYGLQELTEISPTKPEKQNLATPLPLHDDSHSLTRHVSGLHQQSSGRPNVGHQARKSITKRGRKKNKSSNDAKLEPVAAMGTVEFSKKFVNFCHSAPSSSSPGYCHSALSTSSPGTCTSTSTSLGEVVSPGPRNFFDSLLVATNSHTEASSSTTSDSSPCRLASEMKTNSSAKFNLSPSEVSAKSDKEAKSPVSASIGASPKCKFATKFRNSLMKKFSQALQQEMEIRNMQRKKQVPKPSAVPPTQSTNLNPEKVSQVIEQEEQKNIVTSVKRRVKRKLLNEIANTDGFLAEGKRKKVESLFANPSILDREERWLQQEKQPKRRGRKHGKKLKFDINIESPAHVTSTGRGRKKLYNKNDAYEKELFRDQDRKDKMRHKRELKRKILKKSLSSSLATPTEEGIPKKRGRNKKIRPGKDIVVDKVKIIVERVDEQNLNSDRGSRTVASRARQSLELSDTGMGFEDANKEPVGEPHLAAAQVMNAGENVDIGIPATFNQAEMPKILTYMTCNKNLGETVLHKCARLGYEEELLFILENNLVEVNSRDHAGYTAIHESCVRGSLPMSYTLLAFHADVNCSSHDGIRPIHDAVENDHQEVVRLLLSFGADPTLATYTGRTLLSIAHSGRMKAFLKGYLCYLNGSVSEDGHSSWDVQASAIFDPTFMETGFDPFADVPNDDSEDDDDDDDLVFSSRPFITSYRIKVDQSNEAENYLLFNEVIELLDSNREDLLKHYTPVTVTAEYLRDQLIKSQVRKPFRTAQRYNASDCVELLVLDEALQNTVDEYSCQLDTLQSIDITERDLCDKSTVRDVHKYGPESINTEYSAEDENCNSIVPCGTCKTPDLENCCGQRTHGENLTSLNNQNFKDIRTSDIQSEENTRDAPMLDPVLDLPVLDPVLDLPEEMQPHDSRGSDEMPHLTPCAEY